MKFAVAKITTYRDYYDRRFNYAGRCFVSFEGVNVIDWLYARHTFPHKQVKPLVEEILAKEKILYEKIEWNQNAGCTCPCSPGFVLYGCKGYGQVYITLKLVGRITKEEIFEIAPISKLTGKISVPKKRKKK